MSGKQGRGLGRGLSALLSDIEPEEVSTSAAPRGVEMVPIDLIRANPDQPRRHFDTDLIDELADSIRERGIIQPLILRPDPSGEGYQIVAGERRWRAAQRAQLHEAPAVIREMDDATVLEVAIIENIQRADLNAMEEARGYQRLMRDFGRTQLELATYLGKSRSHIANTLRLLSLPDVAAVALSEGKISAGHARALLTAEEPERVLERVLARGLSVRETEALCRGAGAARPSRRPSIDEDQRRYDQRKKDRDTELLEEDLSANLGMLVSIDDKGGNGDLVIHYRNLDDLDRLCGILVGGRRN